MKNTDLDELQKAASIIDRYIYYAKLANYTYIDIAESVFFYASKNSRTDYMTQVNLYKKYKVDLDSHARSLGYAITYHDHIVRLQKI